MLWLVSNRVSLLDADKLRLVELLFIQGLTLDTLSHIFDMKLCLISENLLYLVFRMEKPWKRIVDGFCKVYVKRAKGVINLMVRESQILLGVGGSLIAIEINRELE